MESHEEPESYDCPICIEPLDDADKRFFACPCRFQVCLFCVKRLQTEFEGRCPGCRGKYEKANFFYDDELVIEKESIDESVNKSELRIVKKELVYVIGLPTEIASEEVLKKKEFFGEYGTIRRVAICPNGTSAFVTYVDQQAAKSAIRATNGLWYKENQLRCGFGMTRYCHNFLRNRKCNRRECAFLHEEGKPKDVFTKEQIRAGKRNQFPSISPAVAKTNPSPNLGSYNRLPPKGKDATWMPNDPDCISDSEDLKLSISNVEGIKSQPINNISSKRRRQRQGSLEQREGFAQLGSLLSSLTVEQVSEQEKTAKFGDLLRTLKEVAPHANISLNSLPEKHLGNSTGSNFINLETRQEIKSKNLRNLEAFNDDGQDDDYFDFTKLKRSNSMFEGSEQEAKTELFRGQSMSLKLDQNFEDDLQFLNSFPGRTRGAGE